MKKKRKMSEKKDYSNLFNYTLNLNPWAYNNDFYIFGICVPRRLIWVLLEVCTTTRTKTVKRKRSVLRKLRQDIWRDKTFVRSCKKELELLLNVSIFFGKKSGNPASGSCRISGNPASGSCRISGRISGIRHILWKTSGIRHPAKKPDPAQP